ncbi:MAG: biopolymer transporter ExbD [Gammaproteobacteria bacterium]|nr:biopolymer transporter ExbD [Gammaproteobacteria bacterium]
MAMAVGPAGEDDEDEVMSAINVTPLADAMLVLLIVFLITVPVIVHNVPLQLPQDRNIPAQTKPQDIVISVTRDGDIYWGLERVPDIDALVKRLVKVSVMKPQPEVRIRGDQDARYKPIGQVVLACERAGIVKVGFMTEPPANNQ